MTVWIVTTSDAVAGLRDLARRLGGGVRVVLAAPDAATPAEALAPAVAAAVSAHLGESDVVLAAQRPADKVLAAAVAVAVGLPLLAGVVGAGDGVLEARRHAGLVVERVAAAGVVAIADGGAPDPDFAPDVVIAGPGLDARVVERTPAEPALDLTAAGRVVAFGRDLAAPAGVAAATHLADALGAALAASRPAAEALGWGRDRYVGASGLRIEPRLYVALGVSGQFQHLVGCLDAATIVAVNADAAAPIWAHADYGIVGDVREVAPALADVLRSPA